MKVNWQWLKEYVDLFLNPAELAEVLTHAGLEVENLSEWRPPFQRVVVAKVVSRRNHPQSQHLSVCQVNDGHKDYNIVCGAPNVKEGEKVALALEGASLPATGRISRTIIHGVLSEGMLCSEMELGLSGEAEGIMILDPGQQPGTPLEEALNLADWIFEINITPNRPDCLCVLGLAREVSALTGQELRWPSWKEREEQIGAGLQTSVVIERPDLCPRYVAKLIGRVKIASSPFWLRRRLEAVGLRAINNIVDVTNCVMLEMGQPLHAFDLEQLEEQRIVVRTAIPGSTFVTLDGVERSLPEEALMICDGRKPVALAGIMGGLNSEVQSSSQNILLESAYFDPMGIRRTSKRIGLETEASLRFERGIDPNGSRRAADRAAALMVELASGFVVREPVDNYPQKIESQKIFLRAPRVNQILGTSITPQEIKNCLENLKLSVEPESPESFRVTIPTFRVDLTREIDLIEEVARLQGFQRIPVTLPRGRVAAGKKTKGQRLAEKAKIILASCGFWEVINYSFISPKALLNLKLFPPDRRAIPLRINNPLIEDQAVMRTTLIPGLLQVARHNANRQNFNLKLFELGRVFFPREGQELPEEIEILSGLLCGLRNEEVWSKPIEESDFFDLKGAGEALAEGFGISQYCFRPQQLEPFLHPANSCELVGNEAVLGVMGELHPEVKEAYELDQKIFLFELNFNALVAAAEETRQFKPLSRFPAITRDLSLIVDEETTADELLRALWGANNGWIADIKIFDLYRGKQVPPGKKSLAFRLKYQPVDRTLTDREVNEFHQKLINLLFSHHGGILR